MPTLHLTVHGMNCHHCIARLARVLDTTDGIIATDIVPETGQVSVDYADIEPERIKTAITEAGFEVVA